VDHNDLYFIEASQRDPLLALLGRWLWFVIGPIVLIVLTAMIIITGTGWLTGYDLAFYVTVALMVLGRWIEVRSGYGRTANCNHATPQHFRRYLVRLVPWAILVWTTANYLGNYLLHSL
jgi:hypothetical protein